MIIIWIVVDTITRDENMGYSTEVIVEAMKEIEPLDELKRLYGVDYIQEVLSVEYDEENTEELNIFEEGAEDVKIVEEVTNIGNSRFCQYFIVEE